ncbi:hypothetical protein [Stutzerimonas chloritidismutans]|uniref:hypothetical protein n=1 Tax=Stutzerimonas chloritidismutans TaxID=203192 RepID=UPI003F1541B3
MSKTDPVVPSETLPNTLVNPLLGVFETILKRADENKGRDERREEILEDRGPYLDNKPPLAENDFTLDKDDIANVDDHWQARTGDRLLLWDDMLLVTDKDGKEVLIHPDLHPELHKQAKAMLDGGEVEGGPAWEKAGLSEEHSKWLGQYEARGFEVVEPGDSLPELGSLRFIGPGFLDMDAAVYFDTGFNLTVAEEGDGFLFEHGTAMFETADGKRYAVSKEYNAEAYEELKKMDAQQKAIMEKIDDEGFTVLQPDQDTPVITGDSKVETLADGVKAIEVPGRGKFIVIESLTPEQFATLHGDQVEGQQSSADDVFKDKDLPTAEETDLMRAKTTEKDKTVGELYYEKLKEAYKDEPEDSDKAKYLRLLEAQATLSGGFKYLPYTTNRNAFGTGDNTSYLPDQVEMDPADMRGLMDENALGEELLRLANEPEIIEDNEKFFKEAVDKVKDKDELRDKIADTMRDPEYQEALEELKADGKGEVAEARYASDMQSLRALDPDLAEQIDIELKFGVPIEQLNEIFEDGAEGVGSENIDKATSDVVTTMIATTMSTVFGSKRGSDIFNYYFGGGKEKGQEKLELKPSEQKMVENLTNARPAIEEVVRDRAVANLNDPSAQPKPITGDELNKAMDKAKIPLDQRGGVGGVLGSLAKHGVLSSSAGMLGMVAGIYKMSDGGLNFGETAAERIEVARNFLSFVGVLAPTATMVTGAFDQMFKNAGLADALGIGKDLRETVWDKRHPPKKPDLTTDIPLEMLDPTLGSPDKKPQIENPDFGKPFTPENFWEAFDNRLTASRPALEDTITALPDDQRDRVSNHVDAISNNAPDADSVRKNQRMQWIGGALSAIGGMADSAGGILDIVLGGMGLDKLIKEGGTPEEFAAKGLQIGAGAFGTGMGITGIAAAFGVGGAAIASSVLGAAGSVIGLIAAIIGGVTAMKRDEKTAEGVRDFFRGLEKDGVLEEGWGDKLNYLIHVRYEHNYTFLKNNEQYREWFPDSMPVWEAQPEHFKEFTEKVEKDKRIGDDWFRDTTKDLVVHSSRFDKAFYEEHKDKIDLITDSWDDWEGSDDIVSDKDFEKLLSGKHEATEEQREAVRFLMEHSEFFEFLDTIRYHSNNTREDGKISRRDLDKWLDQVR